MRSALQRLIERSRTLSVSGAAASAEEALSLVGESLPSVFLVDINLPGMNGIELITVLCGRGNARCVAISAHAEPGRVRAAIEAGAAAFVSKDDARNITATLEQVLQA